MAPGTAWHGTIGGLCPTMVPLPASLPPPYRRCHRVWNGATLAPALPS